MRPNPWLWLLALVASGAALTLAPRPALYHGLSFSGTLPGRRGAGTLTPSLDGKFRFWLPLGEISPLLVQATLLRQDPEFRKTTEADPVSLLKPDWITEASSARRLGSSPITLELARLRWGYDTKTLGGRFWQRLKSAKLELVYTKDEILEAYLNLAPYGETVVGAGAASLVYFGKNADQLTLSEALALSALPPAGAPAPINLEAAPREKPVRRSGLGGP